LFEDAEDFEENIKARKGVCTQAYHEKFHVHKQEDYQYVSDYEQEDYQYVLDSEQEDCQYVSDSKQEDSDYESELEQQQGKETIDFDDRDLFSKERGGFLFANREAFTEEQPGLLKQP
jgi:hypothetical protein